MFWGTTLTPFTYQRARNEFQEERDWVENWYHVWTTPLTLDCPWLGAYINTTPKSLNKEKTWFKYSKWTSPWENLKYVPPPSYFLTNTPTPNNKPVIACST